MFPRQALAKPSPSPIRFLAIPLSIFLLGTANGDQYKHRLTKKIGFTENEIETIKGVVPYELEVQTPGTVGISYNQILHLPKLSHAHPLGQPTTVTEVTATLKLSPPPKVKVVAVEVDNVAEQRIEVNGGYGAAVTVPGLKFDATTLAAAELNDEAITVFFEAEPEGSSETAEGFEEPIPLWRVDTISKHLAFVTKKILEEGQHQFDEGSQYVPQSPNSGELIFYFPQSDSAKARISCLGYAVHVLRHGLQKWRGDYAAINPLVDIQGVAASSGIRYIESLAQQDGWSVYYVSKDDTPPENRAPMNTLDKLSITESIVNIDTDPVMTAKVQALLAAAPYGVVIKDSGTHIGNFAENVVYESHWTETGDAIFDRTATFNNFIGGYGFLAIPPN